MEIKISEIRSEDQQKALIHLLAGHPLTIIGAWEHLKVLHIEEAIRQLRRKYGRELIITKMHKNRLNFTDA